MKNLIAIAVALVLVVIVHNCYAEATDHTTEMQKAYDKAIKSFEDGNKVDACYNLKLSKSLAKHSDNIKAYDQLIIMYEKLCNDND